MFKSISISGLFAGLLCILFYKFPNSNVPIELFYIGLILCVPSVIWFGLKIYKRIKEDIF